MMQEQKEMRLKQKKQQEEKKPIRSMRRTHTIHIDEANTQDK